MLVAREPALSPPAGFRARVRVIAVVVALLFTGALVLGGLTGAILG